MGISQGLAEALAHDLDQAGDQRLSLYCIRIAVDARASRYLVRELRAAEAVPDRSPEERIAYLHKVTAVLRELREVWMAAGLAIQGGLRPEQARAPLAAWLEAGQTEAPPASSHEEALAVIATLVIAAPLELFTPAPVFSVEQVRSVLEALGNLPSTNLVGCATVVGGLPGVDLDQLPVPLRDPPLRREDEPMPTMVFCSSCAAPYLEMLTRCPSCGVRAAA